MLLVLLVGSPISAQVATKEPGGAPSPGPGWRPRESSLDVGIFKGWFTAAEKATVIARLGAIEGLFRKVGVLAGLRDLRSGVG